MLSNFRVEEPLKQGWPTQGPEPLKSLLYISHKEGQMADSHQKFNVVWAPPGSLYVVARYDALHKTRHHIGIG